MITYRFCCRSTPDGFTEWALVEDENGVELERVNRDVHLETVRQFRERVGAELEAKGYVPAPNQYTL